MQKIGKISFAAAPVCLFASFFASALFQSRIAMAVFIVLATVFLALALIAKARDAGKGTQEDDPSGKDR